MKYKIACGLLVIGAAGWMPTVSRADLYVTKAVGNGIIASYTESGTQINSSVASGFPIFGPSAMAVSGSTLYVVSPSTGANGKVGAYTTSGAVINASLITGLSDPLRVAVSGTNIYITNYTGGTVGVYDTSGATINSSLISGLADGPGGIAISGAEMYVGVIGDNAIRQYSTSGTLENASLIHTGSLGPFQIAISGSDLFVLNDAVGVIGEFGLDGTTINANLITGLNFSNHVATSMAVDGSNIFVARPTASGYEISAYTTSGMLENASLITGIGGGPIAVGDTPEPSAVGLIAWGGATVLTRRRRWGRRVR